MSGSINSSGSVERFTIAAGEAKEFEVLKPGGTQWLVDVHGDEDQNMTGDLIAVGTSVELQTAEAVAAAAATRTLGVTNTITLTAKAAGVQGNAIQAIIIDPTDNNASLRVVVTGTLIQIYLATDGASAPTSTPALVKAAIDTSPDAAALVSVATAGVAAMAAVALGALSGGADAGAGAYSNVGGAVTVVPGGTANISGATGRYARIINTGAGPAHVVAKPSFRVQIKTAL